MSVIVNRVTDANDVLHFILLEQSSTGLSLMVRPTDPTATDEQIKQDINNLEIASNLLFAISGIPTFENQQWIENGDEQFGGVGAVTLTPIGEVTELP